VLSRPGRRNSIITPQLKRSPHTPPTAMLSLHSVTEKLSSYGLHPYTLNSFYGLACAAIALAIWRVWRFSVFPILYPQDAKELPYAIPILGHGLPFFNDSNALLNKARRYFNHTDEPFLLILFGIPVYFITKAEDIADAYRNTVTLSSEEYYRDLFRQLGTSASSVDKFFAPLSKEKQGFPNPHGKPLVNLARDILIQQLQPVNGTGFAAIERHQLAEIERRMQPEVLRQDAYLPQQPHDDAGIEIELWTWLSDLFVRSAQDAFFGNELGRIDPTLTDTFLTFDGLSWKYLYQYPEFLAKDTIAARNKLHLSLTRYFDLPQQERNSGVAWSTKTTEDEMRAIQMPTEDIAAVMLIVYWGINTNTRKAAFWMLSFVMQRPELVAAIRAETRPAFGASDLSSQLVDLDWLNTHCPLVDAIWNETMRLAGRAASLRLLTSDTVIGGKTLRAGRRLIIPYRQLHFNEKIYGENIGKFRPERWLKDSAKVNAIDSISRGPTGDKSLDKSPSGKTVSHLKSFQNHYRPFGGGSTICPGRFITKRISIILLTVMLRRYDVQMADGSRPEIPVDEWRPVLGIMDPKPGSFFFINITPRKFK
jgi:cytochrome P450